MFVETCALGVVGNSDLLGTVVVCVETCVLGVVGNIDLLAELSDPLVELSDPLAELSVLGRAGVSLLLLRLSGCGSSIVMMSFGRYIKNFLILNCSDCLLQ